MSKSSTIIDSYVVGKPSEWLHNPHAGEMLWSEFMEPLDVSADQLAAMLDVDFGRIADVIAGSERMSADLDLRLARYFRMSPGFFLGLQIEYELLEAKRALNDALDRIVPRAA